MELYEQMRREYEFGDRSIRSISKQFGVHRRTVREALGNALPPPRKKPRRRHSKLEAAIPLIDRMLDEDRRAPRKQRHTAHRIFERLREQVPGFAASERSVRKYVSRRKAEMGLVGRETCIPQSYQWGQQAQVDWYEAWAELGGERVKLQVFAMRSMASGAAFHRAYLRATQQALLEAHELAFAYFGGVFHRLRYDNLTSAVKKILRGHQREETARFVAFRSHWRFQSEFCTPAQAHEKGGVEGEAGYFRRNHWVPVPQAKDLEELNEKLLEGCRADQQRRLPGRDGSIGAALVIERDHLLPLAAEGFDLAETSFATVNGLGCVKVRTNFYSAPLRPGTVAETKLYSTCVEIWHEGRRVSRHQRCYDRYQQILDLEHYLEALERKPGALAGCTPLEQWRKQGRWPASYDQLWQRLMEREGKQSGTRQMIELLRLGREQGWEKLEQAVGLAVELGCRDAAAVRHLMLAETQERRCVERLEVGELSRYERPQPAVDQYDQLLTLGGIQ
jgi:transposase